MSRSSVDEVDVSTAWKALQKAGGLLIDVRTRPEWSFVGIPTMPEDASPLALIEWQSYPAMQVNPEFVSEALAAAREADAGEVHFLCRSGVRSLHAARAVQAAADDQGFEIACINVAGGFEGDPDAEGRRGGVNGWKAAGLPWRQS